MSQVSYHCWSKNISIYFFPIVIVAAGIWIVADNTIAHPLVFSGDPWPYSEWLINYAGGFVRRGLSGEIIAWWQGSAPATSVVNHLVFWDYTAFSVLFLLLIFLSQSRSAAAALLALLVPGGVFDMAKSNAFFQRKEILGTVSLEVVCLLYLLLVSAKSKRFATMALAALLVWTFASSIAFSFVHEAYLFLQLPAVYLILRCVARDFEGVRGLKYVPAAFVGVHILLFANDSIFKGSAAQVQAIWASLNPADQVFISPAPPHVPAGGIVAIGYTLLKGIAYGMSVILSTGLWLWIFVLVTMVLFSLLVTICQNDRIVWKNEKIASSMNVLLFLIIASLPIYIVGSDWGRWISTTTTIYLILSFTFAQRELTQPLSCTPLRISAEQCGGLVKLVDYYKLLLLAVAFTFCLTFSYPECCVNMGGVTVFNYVRPLVKDNAISLGAKFGFRY